MTDHENFNPSEFDSLEFSNHTEAKKAEALFNRLSSQNARLVEGLSNLLPFAISIYLDAYIPDVKINKLLTRGTAITAARALLAEVAKATQS